MLRSELSMLRSEPSLLRVETESQPSLSGERLPQEIRSSGKLRETSPEEDLLAIGREMLHHPGMIIEDSVTQILGRLDGQIAYHREREAFHTQQEEFHRA